MITLAKKKFVSLFSKKTQKKPKKNIKERIINASDDNIEYLVSGFDEDSSVLESLLKKNKNVTSMGMTKLYIYLLIIRNYIYASVVKNDNRFNADAALLYAYNSKKRIWQFDYNKLVDEASKARTVSIKLIIFY